jgi:hypothetical protein
VFRREGDVWALAYDGAVAHLPDSKGLRDLAVLLAAPGRPVHAAQLLTGHPPADAHADPHRAERAREAVTARVRDAIARVGRQHPALGRHLTDAVSTGTWCAYRPPTPVDWEL